MTVDLASIWAWLTAFAVLAYVLLDGFDLGIGVLFPWLGDDADRRRMMNSVAPVWDGNETWLVFGGGALFAAFPLAYAVLLPAFYAPLIVMLLGLIFRGVAFEFRDRTERARWLWDVGFSGGSIAAAFCQGLMLGAFIQGVDVEGRRYAGGWFDWLTPFTLLTGAAVVVGDAMQGCGWLILKTDGRLQARCMRLMRALAAAVLVLIGIVSVWTPLMDSGYAERWFAWPNFVYTAPVPLLVIALAWWLYNGLQRGRALQPFLCAQGLVALCFIGFGVSVYPYIVPRSITIWDAAAPRESLTFLLIGTTILIPIILAYTAHTYWVFRGKASEDAGYH